MQHVKVKVAVGVTVRQDQGEAESCQRCDMALLELFNARDKLETLMKVGEPLIFDGPGQRYREDELSPVEVLRLVVLDLPGVIRAMEEAGDVLDHLAIDCQRRSM